MNNEMQIFENSEFGELGVLEIEGKPYFPATVCAKALGYQRPQDTVRQHCRYSIKHRVPHPQNPSREIEMNFIPEGDLYRLITHSKLPTAERFEKWIFDEVLPSIRKHGGYIAGQESMSGDELMARAVLFAQSKIDELETKNKLLEAKIQADAPAVQFAETIESAKNAISFDKFAKALYDEHGIKIGRNRLFKLLRECKILKMGNVPYQKYMQNGWFKVREVTINGYVYSQTLIYGKGQQKLYELIKSMQTQTEGT